MPTETAPAAKRARRLRPEVIAQLVSRRSEAQLAALYQRPVDDLSPEELRQMKAAFFRS